MPYNSVFRWWILMDVSYKMPTKLWKGGVHLCECWPLIQELTVICINEREREKQEHVCKILNIWISACDYKQCGLIFIWVTILDKHNLTKLITHSCAFQKQICGEGSSAIIQKSNKQWQKMLGRGFSA